MAFANLKKKKCKRKVSREPSFDMWEGCACPTQTSRIKAKEYHSNRTRSKWT